MGPLRGNIIQSSAGTLVDSVTFSGSTSGLQRERGQDNLKKYLKCQPFA